MKKQAHRFFKRLYEKDKLYLRHFKLLLLAFTALVCCTALALFPNFERIARGIIFSDAMTLLEQTGQDASTLVDTGQKLALQIYKDNSVKRLLYKETLTEQDKAVGLEQLANYQSIMKFIDSIYVYNAMNQTFYFSNRPADYHNRIVPASEMPDGEVLRIIEDYDRHQAYSPIPRLVGGRPCYSFFGYDFVDKTKDDKLLCAVIVNISTDWIQDVTAVQDSQIPGESLIVGKEGLVISGSESYPLLSSLAAYPELEGGELLSRFSEDSSGNGWLLAGSGKERLFIAYTKPDALGWRYLRTIPYAAITRDIVRMRNFTFLILTGVLAAGLLLAWGLNRVLYKPIASYRVDLDEMKAREREAFFGLKQDFLRRLLLESGGELPQSVAEQFPDYEIHLPLKGEYRVAALQIDHHEDFIKNYPLGDRESYKFAIMNIAEEICTGPFCTESVDMHDNMLAILLCDQRAFPAPEEEIAKLFEKVRDAVQLHLSLSVSAAISKRGSEIGELGALYEQARFLSFQRMFAGRGCVLLFKIHPLDNGQYPYSERMEKQLIDALAKGNVQKAREIYDEIIMGCVFRPLYVTNATVARLTFAINQLIKTLKPSPDAQGPTFFVDLGNIEVRESLDACFYEIFDRIAQMVEERAGGKGEALVKAVDEMILEQYSDPGLCIEAIADRLGLSASYVGRVYKQNACMTILDRILAVRMERAQEILEHTSEPVSSVAEKIGFSSDSYFYRIFKQECGVTPAVYRKKAKKQ